MAFDSPRIAELRRRIQADPSSIAFAQLAEEHRRAGSFDEAVRVCSAGLERHPGYLSARVTLGRALVELGQLEQAELEFNLVLGTAPDNLAAIRGVAEIHQRRGDLQRALGCYERALALARHDPDLEETVAQISRALSEPKKGPEPGLSFAEVQAELESAVERMAFAGEPPVDTPATEAPAQTTSAPLTRDVGSPAESGEVVDRSDRESLFDFDRLLEALGQPPAAPAPPQVEAWLSGVTPPPVPAGGLGSGIEEQPADPTGTGDDILGQIEEDLRRLEADRLSPAGPPAPNLTPGEQAALDELERWLEVLGDARQPSGGDDVPAP